MSEFCNEINDNKTTVRIMNYNLPFKLGHRLCNDLGGKMPLPTRSRDFAALFGKNLSTYLPSECRNIFWLPIVTSKNSLSKWVDANAGKTEKEVDYLPWAYGQPNGKQQCDHLSLAQFCKTFFFVSASWDK
jgi:hypothetical protein